MKGLLGLGVLGAWSPSNIKNVGFWGNSLPGNYTLVGGNVDTVHDLSGNGNNAQAPGAGNRFALVAGGAPNGTKDCFRGTSAGTSALVIPYSPAIQGLEVSIFCVWRWNNGSFGAGDQALVMHQFSAAWNDGWGFDNGPTFAAGEIQGWVKDYGAASVGATYANNNWRMTEFTHGTVSGFNRFYTDGTLVAQVGHTDPTYLGNSQTVIGAYTVAGGVGAVAGYANWDWCETIISKSEFTATDLLNLHQRAQVLWGTP